MSDITTRLRSPAWKLAPSDVIEAADELDRLSAIERDYRAAEKVLEGCVPRFGTIEEAATTLSVELAQARQREAMLLEMIGMRDTLIASLRIDSATHAARIEQAQKEWLARAAIAPEQI
jgi:uncharacterized protein with HEPN domain